ncbi:MAG: type II secretion system protein [Deltaproteobacteria bacterium]|nr:type II secretion system protein [Candidatus Anaeroferrophillacea bacterium]
MMTGGVSGAGYRAAGDNGGYTLLEVLVALLILGTALGAVFGGMYQAKRASWQADERLTAIRLLHNLLQNDALLKESVDTGAVDGRVPGEEDWEYLLAAEELVIETGEALTEAADAVAADAVEKDAPRDEAAAVGEPVEIPNMYRITACVIHRTPTREKPFCLERWRRK